jgi:hypothetical protein
MWFPGRAAFPTLGPLGGAAFPRSCGGRPRGPRRLSTVGGAVAHGLYTEQPFYCSLGRRLAPRGGVPECGERARRAARDVRTRMVCHS